MFWDTFNCSIVGDSLSPEVKSGWKLAKQCVSWIYIVCWDEEVSGKELLSSA